uniref:PX domain-containing protein n=1 Tax=Noctiluca scintillans TaxID=2966 RepID=A0A7S1AJW5_NOCSC
MKTHPNVDDITDADAEDVQNDLWRCLGFAMSTQKISCHAETVSPTESVALTDEEAGSDANDSDYGLSEVQLGSFADVLDVHDGAIRRRVPARPRSVMAERVCAGRRPALDRPRSRPAWRERSSFPCNRVSQVRSSPSQLRVKLVSTRLVDEVTWYLFEVQGSGSSTYFVKRYSDFVRLNRTLRQGQRRGVGAMAHMYIPVLPGRIPLGLFQAFRLDGFHVRRREGLQRYVACLAVQVDSFDDVPALQAFFGSSAVGGVRTVECPSPRSHCNAADPSSTSPAATHVLL